MTDEDIEKVHRYTIKYSIPAELRSDCPINGCDGCNELRSPDTKRATCIYCENDYCHQCKVKWHNGRTCEQYQAEQAGEDNATRQYLNRIAKRCPHCRYSGGMHTRFDACHHITCTACGHHWCYVCRGRYNQCGCPFQGPTFCGPNAAGQDCGCER